MRLNRSNRSVSCVPASLMLALVASLGLPGAALALDIYGGSGPGAAQPTTVVAPSAAAVARQKARGEIGKSTAPTTVIVAPQPAGTDDGNVYLMPGRVYRSDADYANDKAKTYSSGKESDPNAIVVIGGQVSDGGSSKPLDRNQANARYNRLKARSYIQGEKGPVECGSGNETGVVVGVSPSRDVSVNSSQSGSSAAITSRTNCH